MSDIAHHVNVSGKYSLEFEPSGLHCIVSIRFWKADTLCTVRLMQYRLASDHAAGLLTAIARIFSFLSVQPQLVSVSRCPSELIPILEQSGLLTKGIQYPFRFDTFSLPKLMHQKWGSVFGGINFFSQLRFLVTFLDGCQDEIWATQSPELGKVNIIISVLAGGLIVSFRSQVVLSFRQFQLVLWKSHQFLQYVPSCWRTGGRSMII